MNDNSYLAIRALTKHYRVQQTIVRALDGVDLEIGRGECVGIVGESGSGKTTLAKLLLGIESATGGSIFFNGGVLSMKRNRELRKKIQVVQQNPMLTLNPKRTIKQTVGLPLKIHGGNGSTGVREKVAELPSQLCSAILQPFL